MQTSPSKPKRYRWWPRGRYNRQRIGGLVLKLEINFAWWTWAYHFSSYTHYLHLGPIHLWFDVAYEK